MAHSFVDYHGEHILLRDGDIIIVVYLMMAEKSRMAQSNSVPPFLGKLFEWWEELLEVYGPGCLDLKLDTFLTDEEARAFITRLIDSTKQTISAFGEAIPGDYLNRLVRAPDIIIFGDQPIGYAVGALERLKNLIILTHQGQDNL